MSKAKNNTKQFSLKEAHIKKIKERLFQAKKDYEDNHQLDNLSYNRIHSLLSDIYGDDDTPSVPTIAAIFNTQATQSTINITYIVQLCKLFNKSISYIMSFPDEDEIDVSELTTTYGSDAVPITDPHYLGDFVCYLLRDLSAFENNYSKNRLSNFAAKDILLRADLSLSTSDNVTKAKLVIHTSRTEYNNEPQFFDIVLSGNAYVLKSTSNIIITLTSATHKLYTVMFDYETFNNGPMYFREAAVLSNSGAKRKLPQISKMIILRKEIDTTDYDYMVGMLSLNVNDIIINKETFDKLANTNELVEQLKKDFSKYLQLQKQTSYVISESLFNINSHSSMDFNSFKKAMLILRNNSHSVSNINFGNDHNACDIAKQLQQYVVDED